MHLPASQLRVLDADTDQDCLLDLWGAAFGPDWPVRAGWLRQVMFESTAYRPGDHLVLEVDGQAAGFVLTQTSPAFPQDGSILALGVHPRYRRMGIGRQLHRAGLERLRLRGVRAARLGSGAESYFWPGVPLSLPGAWDFFQKLGWQLAEQSYDLTCSLDDYNTPDWAWQRVQGRQLAFSSAAGQDEAAVTAFVEREYPAWTAFYLQAFAEQRLGDILLARSPERGPITGICLVESPSQRWPDCFSGPVGAPGCLLTAETARERGIGTALAARACEILRERGCRTAFLGWTWLVDWYGKLGFSVWQAYNMSAPRLIAPLEA